MPVMTCSQRVHLRLIHVTGIRVFFVKKHSKTFTWTTDSKWGCSFAFCMRCGRDINIVLGGVKDFRRTKQNALHSRAEKSHVAAKLHEFLRYASKRMQPICKICAPRFDKKCTALLWFAFGFVRQGRITVMRRFLRNVPRFLLNVPQFGKTCRIFTGSVTLLGLWRFIRQRTFRKCDAHGRISAVHGTPR